MKQHLEKIPVTPESISFDGVGIFTVDATWLGETAPGQHELKLQVKAHPLLTADTTAGKSLRTALKHILSTYIAGVFDDPDVTQEVKYES